MAKIDPSLFRAINATVNMSPAEVMANQEEYINRFVEAGLAIIEVRAHMAGEPKKRKKA